MARDVATCTAMMKVLADNFEPTTLELSDLKVALAWTDEAEPGIRTRVEEAAERFPHCKTIQFPTADGTNNVFRREVAEVHAQLFRDHQDAYGENVAEKIRRCLTVTDADVSIAERTRATYRDAATAALGEFDLLLTPTQGFVAPTYEEAADEAPRARILRFTHPFNALGWPALAIPCGLAEHGLPASIQIIGRPGEDALVLAAGESLERAIRQTRGRVPPAREK